jgi:eukaryotic-like serine/threonine-protein kinase
LGKVESFYRAARFEGFEFDLRAGELCREGEKSVRLAEQPFRILTMLLEHPGDLVTREEIRAALWPNGTIVEFEHSISAAINRLRQVLGDSAEEPRYIETLARRGYRWRVAVEWVKRLREDAEPAKVMVRAEAQTPFDRSLIGKKASHYRVLEILGGGGMGIVYKAEDLKLGRRVALKFLPEELASDPAALHRFEREARAASALNHPNICTIHEIEEHEQNPFIVMELLEGETLREVISRSRPGKPPLELDELLDVAIQISEALDAAHRQGIIHRDIKPANIFITKQGQAKILDFGLAKLGSVVTAAGDDQMGQRDDGDPHRTLRESVPLATSDPFLSQSGMAMGTAGYMSPEQVRGEKLDARTDLFSFGLVLYEMATRQRAFSGDTAPVLHDAILKRIPTPARELNPEIPAKLEAIINRALEKNREMRYQSAAAMQADLERLKRPSRLAVPVVSARLKRRLLLVLTSLMILGIAAIALNSYLRHRSASRLAGQGSVVLADFANTTGETVFDGTLRQALAIDLEQSPFLSVLSDATVTTTLKLMNRRPNERLTQQVAREICIRSNSKVLVVGSISSLGSRYAVQLKALNCQTADTLGNAEARAEAREDVLKALRQASDALRRRLGESLASVERFSSPLEQATTSSLEALRAYTQGQIVLRDTGSAEAIPYYKRAAELDPDFARVYAALAVAYGNLNEPSLQGYSRMKACELRDRVAGRERFSIEADCCAGSDVKRSMAAYTQWIQTYPGDAVPHLNLGNEYAEIGQHEEAATEIREYVRLAPDSLLGYGNLVERYLALNRIDEARAALEQAHAHKLDGIYLRVAQYFLGFVENDDGAMQRQVAWAINKPRAEDVLLSAESDTHAYYGRLVEARSLSHRAVESAKKADAKDAAASWEVTAALREAELGNDVQARQAVVEAQVLASGENAELLALALARAGDAIEAQQLADKINKDFPSDTILQVYWLPTIRGAVALVLGNSQRAIDSLKEASAYDLGEVGPSQGGTMYPVYLRGLAYLKAGQSSHAAEQFQNILDHRGLVQNSPLGALAHLQLARARKIGGDTAGARRDYQDFLALWKDADPDIPILKEAKAEYAKLQ